MPSLTGMTLPINTSMASVPASIRSSLVTTASVLLPEDKDKHTWLQKTPLRQETQRVRDSENENKGIYKTEVKKE